MSRDSNNGSKLILDDSQLRRRRLLKPMIVTLVIALIGCWTALSYYVDALWFESLGYASVFWTRLNLQGTIFLAFALVTFVALYGVFWALKPARFGELIGDTIYINEQPLRLPIDPVLNLISLALPL